MFKISIRLKQNCWMSLRHKITSILFTDGHTDGHTDRQADSSISQKYSFSGDLISPAHKPHVFEIKIFFCTGLLKENPHE